MWRRLCKTINASFDFDSISEVSEARASSRKDDRNFGPPFARDTPPCPFDHLPAFHPAATDLECSRRSGLNPGSGSGSGSGLGSGSLVGAGSGSLVFRGDSAGRIAAERAEVESCVWSHLCSQLVLPPRDTVSIIGMAIRASTTDNFPEEGIAKTLNPEPLHIGEQALPSYWSSKGHMDPAANETLLYGLQSRVSLVRGSGACEVCTWLVCRCCLLLAIQAPGRKIGKKKGVER